MASRIYCAAFGCMNSSITHPEISFFRLPGNSERLEDLRDAMLSLVHMFRTSEDKLERHEFREKALGDQLKKMLFGLDKKHRLLEPLKGVISRLDDRLSNVETILLQKEEREKANQNKIQETLELIQKSLPANKVEDNLTVAEESVGQRIDATDKKIEELTKEIQSLKAWLSGGWKKFLKFVMPMKRDIDIVPVSEILKK